MTFMYTSLLLYIIMTFNETRRPILNAKVLHAAIFSTSFFHFFFLLDVPKLRAQGLLMILLPAPML